MGTQYRHCRCIKSSRPGIDPVSREEAACGDERNFGRTGVPKQACVRACKTRPLHRATYLKCCIVQQWCLGEPMSWAVAEHWPDSWLIATVMCARIWLTSSAKFCSAK